GAEHLGVAARRARADIRPFEHGDVADAVVLGQVVGEREAVHAAADDHDVVARPELAPLEEPNGPQEPGHRRSSAASISTRSRTCAATIEGTSRSIRSASTRIRTPTRATSPTREPEAGSSSSDSRANASREPGPSSECTIQPSETLSTTASGSSRTTAARTAASETSPTSATSPGETRHAPGSSLTRSHASAEASTLVTLGVEVRSSATDPRALVVVEGGRHDAGDR